MVQSLFQQLCEAFALAIPVPTRGESLAREFNNLLTEVSCRTTEPVIIVIDAIDELQGGVEGLLPYLPEVLPEHVYLVVSSPHFGGTFPSSADLATCQLCPRGMDQVKSMVLRLRMEPTAELLALAYEVSQGNPLVRRGFLSAYAQSPESEFLALPTIESYYKQTLGALQLGPGAESAYAVLALLAVAQEPLSSAALTQILAIPRRQLPITLTRLRGLLIPVGNRISLCHKSLVDYLLHPDNPGALEVDEVLHAHLRLIDCRERSPELAAYYGRYGIMHLFECGRSEDVVDELERVESPIVPVLARLLFDQTRAAGRSPDTGRHLQVIRLLIDRGSHCCVMVLVSYIEWLIDNSMFSAANSVRSRISASASRLGWLVSFIELKIARMVGEPRRVTILSRNLLSESRLPRYLRPIILHYLAEGYREEGHHQEAISNYRKALGGIESQGDPVTWLQVTCALGDMEYVYGMLPSARQRLEEALSIAKTARLVLMQSAIYRLIGQIEYVLDRFDKATECHQVSLDLALRAKRPYSIVEAYNSLAEAQHRSTPVEALRNLENARRRALDCKGRLELGKSYYVEADVLNWMGDHSVAEERARRALMVLTGVGYGSGIARARFSLSNALVLLARPAEALEYALLALRYYQRENIYPSLRARAFSLLMQAAEATGRACEFQRFEIVGKIPHIANFPNLEPLIGKLPDARSS